MNVKRRAASLLLGLILAACGGTTASQTPAGSAPPSPSATSAPSSSPPAVPSATATSDPSPSPTTPASDIPTGWRHDLVCNADSTGCQLHLYDGAGREHPGWPRDLVGRCWLENLAVGSDGVAYVACKIDDQQVLFSAVDVSGKILPGWPIRETGYPLRVEVSRDGVVFFGTVTEAGDGVLSIHAFGSDGRPNAGWPTELPRTADFAIAPDGTIVAWWYEDLRSDTIETQAARTKFTMIGSNGQTLPGRWPIASIGTATVPVVTEDGSLFYTSDADQVWGHDRNGNIIEGWPYQLPKGVAPELRPDGRLMFILGGWTAHDSTGSDSEIIVLTTGGKVAPGWPYRTSTSIDGPRCCTDCGGPHFPSASSADGTLYVAPWDQDGAQILALDGRGRVVTGWPYRLPAGSRVVDLEIEEGKCIVVTLRDCSAQDGCCNEDADRQITLTPSGELAPE